MASFHGKISWKGQRKRENKNYRYVSFLPDGKRKFQKNSEKIQKLKNTITALFQAKICWKRLRK